MFSLVVLFTVFLGLVGVLVVVSEWQRKWAARAGDPGINLQLLHDWLFDHDCHAPTPEEVIQMLNRAVCKRVHSEDWHDLEVSMLLPDTLPPEFTINSVEVHSKDCVQFVAGVKWPRCAPGVEVGVTGTEGERKDVAGTEGERRGVAGTEGGRIVCHMQFDYLLAEVHVSFTFSDGEFLVSIRHTSPPQMAISCAVISPHVKDPDGLASSVADGMQKLLMSLSLSKERISGAPDMTRTDNRSIGSPYPVLPTVLVSAPEEVEEERRQHSGTEGEEEGTTPGEGGSGEGSDLPRDQQRVSGGSQEEEEEERKSDLESIPPGDSSPPVNRNAEQQPPLEEMPDDPSVSSPPVSAHPPLGSTDSTPPSSPGWRRAPSYEQLQEIVFSPSSPSPTSSLSMQPPRRALTLSLSGSDMFSDELRSTPENQFPSTLVFEVSDSVRVRHIVSLSPAHANKLRRRLSHAKKLHIYNDHVFIATHLKHRRQLCAVCQEKISGTFGKQGYSCRDCGLFVHKQCHYKVEGACSKSTVSTMNLIYPESVSTMSSM